MILSFNDSTDVDSHEFFARQSFLRYSILDDQVYTEQFYTFTQQFENLTQSALQPGHLTGSFFKKTIKRHL